MKPEGYVHGMTDKPAATVHGTGSGEATCELCGAPEGFAGHYTQNGRVIHPIPTFNAVPTPPASPTVTLDRETYKKACELAQEVRDHSTTFDVDEFPSLGREILALLRAAERRK